VNVVLSYGYYYKHGKICDMFKNLDKNYEEYKPEVFSNSINNQGSE
jgi:hypothetical protein